MKSPHSVVYRYFLVQLVRARILADLSQTEAAKRFGVSQPQLSRMESGERRIDIAEAVAFAALYKQPLSYFVPP